MKIHTLNLGLMLAVLTYIVAYSFNKLTKSACLTYQETMYGKEQKLYSEELENSKTF